LDLGTAKLPLLNYVLPDELAELARTGKLPVTEAEILERRGKDQKFLILHDHGVFRIFYGEAAREKFEELVPPIDHEITTELRGATAVRGVITGTVCVYQWGDDIRAKLEIIRKHPILVAGQTRPSMMPIIRLAKGIVTDEGGITSHAAIVSRELGIPSVIGTIYATRVFKDGDLVELDADHGIVRKLS
jgi:phosphohistidine swiveling domain-containing protein